MNKPRTILGLVLAFGLLAAAAGAAPDITKAPGYVDLEWIEIPADADEIKDIDLSPMLLNFAKEAEANGEDAMVQALAMVKSLRVKAFSVSRADDAQVAATVEKVTAQLKKDDWKRLIYVKDDEETIAVSTRYDGEDLVGLMLVAYEPGDSVAFVNVVGDLDLGTLLSLAKKMDHDSIEDMLEELDEVEGIEINVDDHDHDEDEDI